MKTEKLYYTDAYIKEFGAVVLSCEERDGYYLAVLDKTAFFPEEGGQYADRGLLNGIAVDDVREKDGQIIFSAVNKVAHTEIRSVKYLHWWTFIGYFCEVGESVLSVVVTIRNKIKQNKKLEKYEKEFKARNPHYFIWDSRTTEQKQDEEDILSMWNQDKGVPNG